MKARVIMLESAENQRKETDKKCEQMAHRLRETEKKLESNRKEINHYQVRSLFRQNKETVTTVPFSVSVYKRNTSNRECITSVKVAM